MSRRRTLVYECIQKLDILSTNGSCRLSAKSHGSYIVNILNEDVLVNEASSSSAEVRSRDHPDEDHAVWFYFIVENTCYSQAMYRM